MEKELKKQLIKYFKSLGIEVYTNTKARGHQGFYRENRIDISKNIKEDRIIPTLLHEFSHFIHHKIEPDMVKTGGDLEVIFCADLSLRAKEVSAATPKESFLGLLRQNEDFPHNDIHCSILQPFDFSTLQKELLLVTNFVDENSKCLRLNAHKDQVKKRIKEQEQIIKQEYPEFMRSKKFKQFDKVIKKSKAKYLLQYDRIQLISPFLRKREIYSIDMMERDFPTLKPSFCAYIRLRSLQRKQARISARMNKLNKYYQKPTELFARFVEGLYIDEAQARALAPSVTKIFFELLDAGHYFELKHVFEMLQNNVLIAK